MIGFMATEPSRGMPITGNGAAEEPFLRFPQDIATITASAVPTAAGAYPPGLVAEAVAGLKLGAGLNSRVLGVGGGVFAAIATELFFPQGTANNDDVLAAIRLMTQLSQVYPGALVPERNEQGAVVKLRDHAGEPVMWLDGVRGLRLNNDAFPDLPPVAAPAPGAASRPIETFGPDVTGIAHNAPWINAPGEISYRSEARTIARSHNADAALDDLIVPIPVAAPDGRVTLGYLRGSLGAIAEQAGAMARSGRMIEDFDLRGMAESVGINWDRAMGHFADRRAFQIAARDPMTFAGESTRVFPRRDEALAAARASNAIPDGRLSLYLPIELDVASESLALRGRSHQVYSGSLGKLKDFFEAMREQGRLPPGANFDDLSRRSGVTSEARAVSSADGSTLDDPRGLSEGEARDLGLDGRPTPPLRSPAVDPLPESFPAGEESDPRSGLFENPGAPELGPLIPPHTGQEAASLRAIAELLNLGGFFEQSNLPAPILRNRPQPSQPVEPTTSAASASAGMTPLDDAEIQQIARYLARGHAFRKHGSEFAELGITTRAQFRDHVADILTRMPEQIVMGDGRIAVYDEASNTLIIYEDASRYAVTAFRPKRGRRYLEKFN